MDSKRKKRSVTASTILIVFVTCCLYTLYILKFENPRSSSPVSLLPTINTLKKIEHVTDLNQEYVFVGDIHGNYDEFIELIDDKIGGLRENTTMILLGDFIHKGPDSDKVVSYILNHKDQVKCVLGNHEILVMMAYLNPDYSQWVRHPKLMIPLTFSTETDFIPQDISKISGAHARLAHELGFSKLSQLAEHCSMVIELDLDVTDDKLFGVHAGMLPGDFIKSNQIPSVSSLSNMKFVNKKHWSKTSREKENKNYVRWFTMWDKYGDSFSNAKVFYGHDASMGLNLRKQTKGLDTACVKDNLLSSMRVKYNGKKEQYEYTLIQVECS
ncbi:putative serine/threonine-protein phosphatase SKDI_14G1120 [Saccharomyces kudriavzevii IFO 1802]|uniref:Uncharacterized protein n=2 Tax=Saccharomyces kudriavzevii (strain ATCC MYA-4449 / AS 2.2408 / CBS 8840 / NBRC 1802 / NCYC 2889) TaxID=226230 RepID=A0AA35NLA6_SACK1|nr:uncharacterized protein SKDI_14G1120 [Saccharomyces kudriavzevii IFO 1802]EJT42830.1 YNL217W-like protein [Saccharomyces kudriavzevii IFO 1802]CAI4049564.1 hypothetical protein SKDI_14G1120 [Saccharomyces kudriavzevii IFO 1802]